MTWRELCLCFRLSSSRYTDRLVNVVRAAWRMADGDGAEFVRPEHLLGGLASPRYPATLDRLAHLGINLRDCFEELSAASRTIEPRARTRPTSLGPEVQAILDDARSLARGMGHAHVGTEHLILAMLAHPGDVPAGYLRTRGADPEFIRRIIA